MDQREIKKLLIEATIQGVLWAFMFNYVRKGPIDLQSKSQ